MSRSQARLLARDYEVELVKSHRLIAELEPLQKREKLEARLKILMEYFDTIDIPDAPLGAPSASSAVLAAYIWGKYGVDVIPHIRVADTNTLGLVNLVTGLAAIGLKEVLVLAGDPPRVGNIVGEVSVDDVPALVKMHARSVPRIGALVSLRKPREQIEQRLSRPFSFYFILRPTIDVEKLEWLSREAHKLNKRVYAYIIVVGEKNRHILDMLLGDQPVYEVGDAVKVMDDLSGLVDGFIVSSPGDVEAIASVARMFTRR